MFVFISVVGVVVVVGDIVVVMVFLVVVVFVFFVALVGGVLLSLFDVVVGFVRAIVVGRCRRCRK